MKRVLVCVFLLCALRICAQVNFSSIDSLYSVIEKTTDDSLKVDIYNRIAFTYIFNDINKTINVLDKGSSLAITTNNNYGLTLITNTRGIYMDVSEQKDSAKYYFNESLQLSKLHRYSDLESRAINNLGMFNWNQGKYQKALDYFFKSLELDEKNNRESATAIRLNNIGLIYQEMNLVKKGLEYHLKSLKLRRRFGLKNDQVASLNNIGVCLYELERYNEAMEAYEEGLVLAVEVNNMLDYYRIIENLGSLYEEKKEYRKALEKYLEVINKPKNLVLNKKGALINYGKVIGLYSKFNEIKKAETYIEKGMAILNSFENYMVYADDYFINSSEVFYRLGKIDEARGFTKRFVTVKDSLFSINNAEAMADLEIKYQTEKKEKQILSQRANIAEKELNINQKNTQIIGLGLLVVVISVLGYLLYNQQKLKTNQLKKESELKAALIKIETQNRLQDQRLRISRDLHDNIGAQLTFIISSIENLQYGFKLKNEKLTSKLVGISDFTKDTIYELRDTIWAMNKNSITIDDLQARISNFIDKANLSSSLIVFSFNVDDNISKEEVFSSVTGMNVYRIIQEATNNAIKHAEASKIDVSFKKMKNKVLVTIVDNGRGFDESKIELGSGLSNMRKRGKDINAGIKIESFLDEGTQISVVV